jgi:hypothetical protein
VSLLGCHIPPLLFVASDLLFELYTGFTGERRTCHLWYSTPAKGVPYCTYHIGCFGDLPPLGDSTLDYAFDCTRMWFNDTASVQPN